MENKKPKVILIGGAPGAGKTTLATALVARLGMTSLSIDDLKTAAQAITTPQTHPKLHVMSRAPAVEYFTNSTIEQLKAEATQQHEAVWPMVERVVGAHATWGSPIVIDGWHLRPSWVAQLNQKNVWSGWIVTTAEVLRAREKKLAWYQESTHPDRMLENFLARSLWYNDLIREQARQQGMTILPQSGNMSVEQLCDLVIESVGA